MPNDEEKLYRELNFHSDEASDILGKLPSWTIRWGVSVIFITFAVIVAGCYFIKYPQTVEAPIIITTLNPPVDLIACLDGRIDTIYVADGQEVK